MQYGLNLPIGGSGSDPRILAEFAALAEEVGWDGVFLEDYIVYTNTTYHSAPGFPTHDPWVALAAMAISTTRVRLGTTVTALSRRRPWKLARETVSLDHLSGGRLILGAGSGDVHDAGFSRVGEVTDAKQRAEMLDESLTIVDGLWSGEPFSYHGSHYAVDDVTFLPRPLQTPRIPIWIGGGGPHRGPVRRAARWDGACLYKETDDGDGQDMMAADVSGLKRAIADERETDAPFDIVVGGRPRRDDSEQERAHIRSVAQAGATWWLEWIPANDIDVMRAAIWRGPLRID
jgi:alkanesulfonate monooxygenase SsuD/methylene tetrahydromethanopterin reductase-like flavin-dependent oxidoreductase (luciferase family)